MNQDKQFISAVQNIIRTCLDDYLGQIIDQLTQIVLQELRNNRLINIEENLIFQEQQIKINFKLENANKYIPSLDIQLTNLQREIESMKIMFKEENQYRLQQFHQIITNVIDSQQILINQKTNIYKRDCQQLDVRLRNIESQIFSFHL